LLTPAHIIIIFLDQKQVSTERQIALTRLCTGLATVPASVRGVHDNGTDEGASVTTDKGPCAVVEGVQYKVVWSCLLLVEMVMTNLAAAAHFQSLASNAVPKVVELLRLWNARASNLVLGAGAIHSAAKLKSINAKHLSYVTQCLGMLMALLPHIRAALMAQLTAKQYTLLSEIDKIKKEYQDHNEKVLNKFVSIIGGIVEQGLAPRIANTDFAAREKDFPFDKLDEIKCCVFLEGILSSTRKLHQVLNSLLPPDHLQDVFTRIFAYLDEKIPVLFIAAAAPLNNGSPSFNLPTNDRGKRRFVLEVVHTTNSLNALNGVHPWEFTATTVLERKMDFQLSNINAITENLKFEQKEEQDSAKEPNVDRPSNDIRNENVSDSIMAKVQDPESVVTASPIINGGGTSSKIEREHQQENGTLATREGKADERATEICVASPN
jgi:vacuolar protein sorting-associated protein 54